MSLRVDYDERAIDQATAFLDDPPGIRAVLEAIDRLTDDPAQPGRFPTGHLTYAGCEWAGTGSRTRLPTTRSRSATSHAAQETDPKEASGLDCPLASGFRLRLARRRRSNEKVPLTWKNRTCLGTYQPRVEGTFPVKNSARTARVMVSADGRGLVSQAGAVLLWETMRVTGLGRGLSTGLDRWRAPRATSPPREELSRNSVHLDEAGPRPRGTSSQGRLNELTECQT